MQVYECLAVDVETRDCTNWQLMEVPTTTNEALLTKQQVNDLTVAIIGFLVIVFVWLQIKKSI